MPARVGSPAGLPGSPKGVGVPRARAVRELDSSAVGIHDIKALDAVLTLARVAYDAHRSAPRKDTRTDAVNKLRIAEDLLVTAIENPRSREAPESATASLLQARLRQLRYQGALTRLGSGRPLVETYAARGSAARAFFS